MMTEIEAFKSMLAHHRDLEEGVAARAAAVTEAEKRGTSCSEPVGRLVAFLADEVLPHAQAEEQTIYQVAAARPEQDRLVREMVAEHRALVARADRLATLSEAPAAAEEARGIATSFSAHVARENDTLLPPLLADDQVDLPGVLEELRRLTERTRRPCPTRPKELTAGRGRGRRGGHRAPRGGVRWPGDATRRRG